jgi:hypothetical protein
MSPTLSGADKEIWVQKERRIVAPTPSFSQLIYIYIYRERERERERERKGLGRSNSEEEARNSRIIQMYRNDLAVCVLIVTVWVYAPKLLFPLLSYLCFYAILDLLIEKYILRKRMAAPASATGDEPRINPDQILGIQVFCPHCNYEFQYVISMGTCPLCRRHSFQVGEPVPPNIDRV